MKNNLIGTVLHACLSQNDLYTINNYQSKCILHHIISMIENYPTLIKIISFILTPVLLCELLHCCSTDSLRKSGVSLSETQISEPQDF